MDDAKVKHIKQELEKVTKNLETLRNLRNEIGSKVLAADAYRRYLKSKLGETEEEQQP